jgi:hypothetical protein
MAANGFPTREREGGFKKPPAEDIPEPLGEDFFCVPVLGDEKSRSWLKSEILGVLAQQTGFQLKLD